MEPQTNYTELSEIISNNLNSIAEGLRAKNQTFTNTELVELLGKENLETKYGVNSDAVMSYSVNFKKLDFQKARKNEGLNLSDEANQYLRLIQSKSNTAIHLKEYKESLRVINQSIIDSDLSDDEKEILKTQIVSLQSSLSFMAANFDLFQNQTATNGKVDVDGGKEKIEDEDKGWWDSWGKCAAGTLGGALTGGLGGAGIGSAVPVIGTTVGGVVGAIGGGLTGAAASC
ncbi:hypothetical protein LVD15_18885 [Fulvivirga maritima]|uniref:hypothetical protein n=1 Tax=Fulvivirga maritima TaxID=2904247 RepID=UPI001F3D8EC3|nr:hypothetical protein [Fulvivirga maritima]UII25352.1 hypothetical protein LVD15_18885 [Fulvivirga maritima]